MKYYIGFAICLKKDKSSIFFKQKKTEEIFYKVRVFANSFAEAQRKLCDTMQSYKMSVAFIFPYVGEDMK